MRDLIQEHTFVCKYAHTIISLFEPYVNNVLLRNDSADSSV
jgi:hypothetical protein